MTDIFLGSTHSPSCALKTICPSVFLLPRLAGKKNQGDTNGNITITIVTQSWKGPTHTLHCGSTSKSSNIVLFHSRLK